MENNELDYDDYWYDRELSPEELEDERLERELEEFSCTCGAYVISKKTYRIVHIADCLCGYG